MWSNCVTYMQEGLNDFLYDQDGLINDYKKVSIYKLSKKKSQYGPELHFSQSTALRIGEAELGSAHLSSKTQKAEAKRPEVPVQPGLHSVMLSQGIMC